MADQKYNFNGFTLDALNNAIAKCGTISGSELFSNVDTHVCQEKVKIPIYSRRLENAPELPALSADAKTMIIEDDLGVKFAYRNGSQIEVSKAIIPEICDIEIYNEKVIKVYFEDDTVECAVLNENDTYSFEYGVSICIIKRILSGMTCGNGTSVYNKLIDYALSVYKGNREFEKATAEFEKKVAEEAKNKAEKEKQRRIKIANKKREREIKIHAEAYYRAMQKFSDEQIAKFGMDCIASIESTDETPESVKDKAEN